MAPYLISYDTGNGEYGVFGSYVLDLSRPPESLREVREIEGILAIEGGADIAILLATDRLVTQEEHPCVGPPYGFHTVFVTQMAGPDGKPRKAGSVGRARLLRAQPICTLDDVRQVEVELRLDTAFDATALLRLIPVSDLPDDEVLAYKRKVERQS